MRPKADMDVNTGKLISLDNPSIAGFDRQGRRCYSCDFSGKKGAEPPAGEGCDEGLAIRHPPEGAG